MGVLAIGIVGMVVYFVTRQPAQEIAAAAPAQQIEPRKVPVQPADADSPKQSQEIVGDSLKTPRKPANSQSRPVDTQPKDLDAPVETPPPAAESNEPKGTPVLGINVGNQILEIEGNDLDGKSFKISDYRGKVVLLDFWGFW